MGAGAPTLEQFFAAAAGLKVRATCVMARGFVDSTAGVERYMQALNQFGVREFTFKHTYVAYENSVFRGSPEDCWAASHQVNTNPFVGRGEIVARLPWGPAIRKLDHLQVCYYFEPDPGWEKEHHLCRSINLLSDGRAYASLEDRRSQLFRLNASRARSGLTK
jgi:cyclic pyranopterin phosphate synthase